MQLSIFLIFVVVLLLEAITVESQSVDIAQTAINNGNFKTLITAVQTAGLVTTLKSGGPFAPTDNAFGKLPSGTLTNLLKPENKGQLVDILTYHVVSGNLSAASIVALHPPVHVRTLSNYPVLVTRNGNSFRVNNANVIIPDVFTTNDVIHAIDTVLIPRRIRRMRRHSSISFIDKLPE